MITPTESCSGEATWNTCPNASGEGLPPWGAVCAPRSRNGSARRIRPTPCCPGSSEKRFRCPGSSDGRVLVPGSLPTAPNVTPPANAAPPLRSSLRLVRFESISPSFERNDTTTKSRARGREHMPTCQLWRVLMSRGLRILKRQLVRRLPAAWRVGADHPQAQPGSVRADTPSVQGCLNVLAAPIHRGADFGG